MARPEEFAADVRRHTRAIWDNLNALASLQREWNALDYGTSLPAEIDGVPRAALGSVVFDTTDALEDVLAAGHATNMAKLL